MMEKRKEQLCKRQVDSIDKDQRNSRLGEALNRNVSVANTDQADGIGLHRVEKADGFADGHFVVAVHVDDGGGRHKRKALRLPLPGRSVACKPLLLLSANLRHDDSSPRFS